VEWLENFFKGYVLADALYMATLLVVVMCLYRGHRGGSLNLWDVVRTTKGDATFTDPRKLYECGAFVVSTVGFSYLIIVGKMSEWFFAGYIGAWVAARYARDREQRLNRAMDMQQKQGGFAQAELVIALACVALFALWTAGAFWYGGSAPRRELADLRASIEQAQEARKKEDDRRREQTDALIKEKDDDRTKELARVGVAWSAQYGRMRADRDRLAGERAQSAGETPGVCNGADGNQRLRDALLANERDADAAVGEFKEGVARLLEVAQRQAAEWDSLKSAVRGVRGVNAEGR
jgi:hypothetical protein